MMHDLMVHYNHHRQIYEPILALSILAIAGLITLTVLRAVWWLLSLPFRRRGDRSGREPPPGIKETLLSCVLLAWTKTDFLTLRDLLNGGIVIFGRPGSGKSSSSFRAILQACVDLPVSGGLILAASPSDAGMVDRVFARHQDRLITMHERTKWRFNALNYIMAHGGGIKDVVAAIYAIAETVERGGSQGGSGGEDGSFFSKGARLIVEYVATVVWHGTGKLCPADMLEFLNTAASSVAERDSEAFQKTFHWRCFDIADEKEKTEVEQMDYALAAVYFSKAFPKLADRTRTSLTATVLNFYHILNSGYNRLLFGGDTNLTPEEMDKGKWIFVDMPISRMGMAGSFALGLMKFMTEWHVQKRDSSAANPPLIIAVDEFQNSINLYDTQFLGECRKFSSCMIAATQSKASFYANMGGESAEAKVDSMLNNFSQKIMHALGDVKTAQWASELCGSEMMWHTGGTEQSPESLVSELLGHNIWAGNIGESMRPVLEPKAFMHGLRTGGDVNGKICDGYLIRSGEPFANGRNFLKLPFHQE